jgi:3-hydroxybutyryl-CoA dehydrogenase
MEVHLHEPNPAPLERSRRRLVESVSRAVERRKLTAAEAEALRARMHWTTNRDDLAGCDLAIEAVTEDPEVKEPVFHCLDRALGPDAIIASNTSSIPIAELAAQTERRDRVLGLHFFSPAPVMKLVEVVVGIDTSPESVDRAEAFVKRIGKRPIRTKDRSGFIVNMLLVPYLMAGVRMYEEGFATAEDIDEGMKLGCGHPMGPLELADFIGLDVLYAVLRLVIRGVQAAGVRPTPAAQADGGLRPSWTQERTRVPRVRRWRRLRKRPSRPGCLLSRHLLRRRRRPRGAGVTALAWGGHCAAAAMGSPARR